MIAIAALSISPRHNQHKKQQLDWIHLIQYKDIISSKSKSYHPIAALKCYRLRNYSILKFEFSEEIILMF